MIGSEALLSVVVTSISEYDASEVGIGSEALFSVVVTSISEYGGSEVVICGNLNVGCE